MRIKSTILISLATTSNPISAQIRDNQDNSLQLNIDQKEFDNKWQQMGVCGIPSVEVDKSIMTGISQNILHSVRK